MDKPIDTIIRKALIEWLETEIRPYYAEPTKRIIWELKSGSFSSESEGEADIGRAVLGTQLIDEVDRHAKSLASNFRLSVENATLQAENKAMQTAIESYTRIERDMECDYEVLLVERNKQLLENARVHLENDKYKILVNSLTDENERLRDALKWYADKSIYNQNEDAFNPEVLYDKGDRAQAALSPTSETAVQPTNPMEGVLNVFKQAADIHKHHAKQIANMLTNLSGEGR